MSGEDEDAAPEVDRIPETDEDLRDLEEVTAIAPSSSAGAPRARPSSVAERMARRAKKRSARPHGALRPLPVGETDRQGRHGAHVPGPPSQPELHGGGERSSTREFAETDPACPQASA